MQAQFFPDLKEFCVAAADKHHKAVIVAGLDGDFRREAFGQARQTHVLCSDACQLTSTRRYCPLCRMRTW